jgi:hypothetical protein
MKCFLGRLSGDGLTATNGSKPDTHLRGKTRDLKIYEVVSMKAVAAV